ncbi:MAG: 4Fe-4S binding protein [Rudaea sp.]
MADPIYDRLADSLNALPSGFPRTQSGVEIRILKKMFSEEQAELAGQLRGEFEQAADIAARIALPVKDVTGRLFEMTRKGLIWFDKVDGRPCFRLAPFVVGSYEAQIDELDHEYAHLMEAYMLEGGAAGIMQPQPALHRVVPAQSAYKSETILPYDDVRLLFLSAKAYHVEECICRKERALVDHACDFPKSMCFSVSERERTPVEGDISRDDAMALLARAEEIGLVHTVSNVARGVSYVCNCCGCCCAILRGINEWGIAKSVAAANYYAVIDPEFCAGCGNCRERCQVKAISEQDGVSVVDRGKCIGCGLCVSGCPNEVARLVKKPEAEMVQPPADYAAWEHARLVNRGLAS